MIFLFKILTFPEASEIVCKIAAILFGPECGKFDMYRQISIIGHTKSQHLNVPCLVSQLSLPKPLKPGVKSRMKMSLEQRRQAMLQLHLSDQQFYCLLRLLEV